MFNIHRLYVPSDEAMPLMMPGMMSRGIFCIVWWANFAASFKGHDNTRGHLGRTGQAGCFDAWIHAEAE
jgi:hypothetical protein